MSPNFREHCQALFTTPLFEHHDRARFELFAYSLGRHRDGLTDRLALCFDVWRDVSELDNASIAARIREDEIDVLVDLTMHMGGNRALLFARKPAPVQIAWLAYPGTTGLSAMDYRVTDVHLDPPGNDRLYAERSLRLPETFWAYDPLTATPDVGPLPALEKGYLTFGSLNTFRKMNELTADLWAPVLRAVTTARLSLLAPLGKARTRVASWFLARDVDPSIVSRASASRSPVPTA